MVMVRLDVRLVQSTEQCSTGLGTRREREGLRCSTSWRKRRASVSGRCTVSRWFRSAKSFRLPETTEETVEGRPPGPSLKRVRA
jgi:hypothetical protein